MRSCTLFILLLIICQNPAFSQSDYAEDVSSIDHIITALYDVISGEKGVKRDWDRFNNLFLPEARLIPTNTDSLGNANIDILTPIAYVERAGDYLEANGFHEVEIHRVQEHFGSLVHLWSTYESYHSKSDEVPFARGINSIQLLNDGNRWWVLQIYWLGENDKLPIPDKYLPD